MIVGCGKKPTPAPTTPEMTPERIKMLVGVVEGNAIQAFGGDVRLDAAEQLGNLGQAAKDAGAVPALTKLSKSGKASKETKAAAVAALAKLNGAAPPP
jgi:hypothetical protein